MDLCTSLNALQSPDILHSYFNIRFLLAGVLSNCGCLLYYKSMWQQSGMPLEEFTVPIRETIQVPLKTLHKVLVEHPKAADWEEQLSYIAYSFLLVSCLVWSYHRPGPAPGEHNELTGVVAQNKAGFCSPTQDKVALWLHSPGLPLWSCGVRDAWVGKRLILEISSR